MDLWEQIKQRLRGKLSPESYQSWFANTVLDRHSGQTLHVHVPTDDARAWIQSEYSGLVAATLLDIRGNATEVVFSAAPHPLYQLDSEPSSTESLFGATGSQLNARYIFDNFIVGNCNQFAHAAARAVSNRPARAYNPLFIYGGSGMGKTHLIHAIGHSLSDSAHGLRVVYTSTERFVNHLITCIRTDRMQLFHQHYRSADVLLMDDIQILGGKERTQEEFFHTFNDLYDHQKQIVLSSDSLPSGIPNLVDRLRSRFEWGLIADVKPPDLETKQAILEKKAQLEGVYLPSDVRDFLAIKTRTSVRELEGALIKLTAYSSMTGEPISLDMARQLLRQLSPAHDRKITIDAVTKAVAEHLELSPGQIKHKSNERKYTHPRQIAMYLAKELTHASFPEIGRSFGGKHHTTVLHAHAKIARDRQLDPDLNRLINKIMDSFH